MLKSYRIRIYDEDETNLIIAYSILAQSFTDAVNKASKTFKLNANYNSMKTYVYK